LVFWWVTVVGSVRPWEGMAVGPRESTANRELANGGLRALEQVWAA